MPNLSGTNNEFRDDFRQKEDPDWAAQLQHLCDTFRAHLDDADDDAASLQDATDAFIDVLLEKQTFFVAGPVVPDFRSEPATKHENLHKQHIIERTAHLRLEQIQLKTMTPTDFDDPLHRAEKEISAEAEMHRAGLLLHYRGKISEMERKEPRVWWEARPGTMRKVRAIEEMDQREAEGMRDVGVEDEDHTMDSAAGEESETGEVRGMKRQCGQ